MELEYYVMIASNCEIPAAAAAAAAISVYVYFELIACGEFSARTNEMTIIAISRFSMSMAVFWVVSTAESS